MLLKIFFNKKKTDPERSFIAFIKPYLKSHGFGQDLVLDDGLVEFFFLLLWCVFLFWCFGCFVCVFSVSIYFVFCGVFFGVV